MEGVSLLAAKGIWAEILAAVPFLNVPIIGPIASTAFFWLVSFLVGKSQKFANILIIGFQVARQRESYDKAVEELQQALADAKIKGDSDALQKASDAFDDALADLIHNDIAGDNP